MFGNILQCNLHRRLRRLNFKKTIAIFPFRNLLKICESKSITRFIKLGNRDELWTALLTSESDRCERLVDSMQRNYSK